MLADNRARTSHTVTKLLLVCGVAGGLLFTAAWLIEGATRIDYNPLRHPISSLSIGDFGWTQVSSFIVTGILTLAYAFGLKRALQSRGGGPPGRLCSSPRWPSGSLARAFSSPIR